MFHNTKQYASREDVRKALFSISKGMAAFPGHLVDHYRFLKKLTQDEARGRCTTLKRVMPFTNPFEFTYFFDTPEKLTPVTPKHAVTCRYTGVGKLLELNVQLFGENGKNLMEADEKVLRKKTAEELGLDLELLGQQVAEAVNSARKKVHVQKYNAYVDKFQDHDIVPIDTRVFYSPPVSREDKKEIAAFQNSLAGKDATTQLSAIRMLIQKETDEKAEDLVEDIKEALAGGEFETAEVAHNTYDYIRNQDLDNDLPRAFDPFYFGIYDKETKRFEDLLRGVMEATGQDYGATVEELDYQKNPDIADLSPNIFDEPAIDSFLDTIADWEAQQAKDKQNGKAVEFETIEALVNSREVAHFMTVEGTRPDPFLVMDTLKFWRGQYDTKQMKQAVDNHWKRSQKLYNKWRYEQDQKGLGYETPRQILPAGLEAQEDQEYQDRLAKKKEILKASQKE